MTPQLHRRPWKSLAAAVLLVAAASAAGAPPTVRNLDLSGLQIGAATVLTIDGDNLLPDPKILLGVPIAGVVVRKESTANRVVIEVSLDKSAVPGMYNLRVANANGVSASRVVALDHLPQRPWAKETALPAALHATLAGSNRMTTSFSGKAGQGVLCEVEAQRLGGKLRPVLHLYDEGGRQLAWAWPNPALGGDSRIACTLPADGKYTVDIHDLQYASQGGPFRLKLGSWQHVDAVFPPAVRRGESASVELVGNTAGQRVQVQATGDRSVVPVPWADPAAACGLRPRVLISDLPEYVEKDGVAIQDAGRVPVALNGRLVKAGEVDRYRLQVQPGDKLRFEVLADRLGSPLDAVLKLQREDGALLAQADDAPGSPDPTLDFTVPADLKTLVVAVEDLHGRGQPNYVYRIVVRPAAEAAAITDFALFLSGSELSVPAGGSTVIEVGVERRGYAGPIRLAFDGLPTGIAVQGSEVPAGATGALLVLTGTGATPAAGVVSLSGTATEAKTPLIQRAHEQGHPLLKVQPWLAEELAIALTPKEKMAFAPQWGTLTADAKLIPGSSLKVPLHVVLPKEENGGVRLYLLSSHRTPRANGQPDQNQALRKDAGPFLELPAGKGEGEFVVFVPATLPGVPHDLAFRADLLSKDRGRVIAQAFTPVKRFDVLNPLAVLPAAARVEATLDAKTGAEVKLAGKVERRGGFKGDVTVSVAGLPPGIAVPTQALKADKADFQLAVKFPATFKARDLLKVEVFATGKYAPNSPLPNRSEPAAVRLKLVPAPAPPPAKK
jgi:hypothetical protein